VQKQHVDYVMSAANLRAEVYGIPQNRDRVAIIKMIQNVVVPEFTPRSGVRIDVTDSEAQSRQNDNMSGESASRGTVFGTVASFSAAVHL